MLIRVAPTERPPLPPGESLMTLLIAEMGEDWLRFYDRLTPLERLILQHDWSLWERDAQRAPEGDWNVWVIMAGRGFGKTRPGAEMVNRWAEELGPLHGKYGHIALLGKDPEDIRKVMIEGESGILACAPPWFQPRWEPTKKQLTWPNGVKASVYSSEEPDQLRGPQHHKLWGDEICKWKKARDMWDMASFGLRLGHNPQAVLTTTPRPLDVLIEILKDTGTVVTTGSTFENEANLAPIFLERMKRKYANTRLGRQELNAELLLDVPGALWNRAMIERTRVETAPPLDEFVSIVVAIDPSVTDAKEREKLLEEGSALAECGMVVIGKHENGDGYVLHDLSDFMTPHEWGTKAVTYYETLKCERVIGEVNNGGDLVEFLVKVCAREQGYDVNFKSVHASRGKRTRAEPVAAMYEQGRIHHVGMFTELEDQMCTWMPGEKSPDRMDALVWGATEVMLLSPDDLLFR
jgi:predicted phage terminase large subunit-like protein